MLIALPPIVLIGLVLLLWRACAGFRTGVLAAGVIWSLLLVLITESLSAFEAITPRGLGMAWGVMLAILAGVGIALRLRGRVPAGRDGAKPGWLIWVWCLGIAMIVVAVGVIAWVAPPNTWDSMTYHMARVAHWRQNHSVAPYPTNNVRQLWLQPGAEYGVLHFQVLTGGDRLANFVQWLAMVGTVLGVSAIARQLGAGAAGQALAAVFAATLPMGILQASSTQTDYVAAFFLVCLAFFLFRLLGWAGTAPGTVAAPWQRWADGILAGAALGLGVLTKATTGLFALPLLLAAVWVLWRRRSPALLGQLALAGALGLAINLPFLVRNQEVFGSPLGPDSANYRNATLGVRTTISNLVRCAALHLACPSKPVAERVTAVIAAGLRDLSINPSDPRTSYNASTFAIPSDPLHEDLAGSPLHLLMGLLALPALLFLPRLRRFTTARVLALAIMGGTLIFCAYLRWQPWSNRLELPLFALMAAPVATVAEALWPRRLPHILAPILLLTSLPWVISNRCRPMYSPTGPGIFSVSREAAYFVGTPNAQQMFMTLKRFAGAVKSRRYNNVGLVMEDNDGEYLVWAVLQGDVPWAVRVEHMNVRNASAVLGRLPRFKDFTPQMTIQISAAAPRG